jgi:hypothetical protein
MRTTLRHPEFSFGWKNIVDLNSPTKKKYMKQMACL